MDRSKKIIIDYKNYFNDDAKDLFSSSGRIEILGNHTDHNHGKVIVGAVNLDLLAATKKSKSIHLYSEGYEEIKFDLTDLEKKKEEEGTNKAIIKGVLVKMMDLGYKVGGFTAYVNSILPAGSGISSSAAFECLIAEIENYYYNNDSMNRFDMAIASQFAEHIYFGKPCGLLDQCGVAFGGINKIDFSKIDNPTVTHLDFNLEGYSLVLVNTGGSHSNLTDAYASIPQEMKSVAKYFGKNTLSEVDEKIFYDSIKELRNHVNDRAILRAIHFYNENKTVESGFNALKNCDKDAFLNAVKESGESSYMFLQNTCVPGSLTQNINLALAVSKKYVHDGAFRIHGGGFEGTILVFISNACVEEYIKQMVKIFGENNVHKISVRNEGSYHVKEI
ncbi:MAG: hypothetical protein MR357_03945 [Anaeroplasma sp.]|nr:hypothetical protein [Anaeroplasma sp.]